MKKEEKPCVAYVRSVAGKEKAESEPDENRIFWFIYSAVLLIMLNDKKYKYT